MSQTITKVDQKAVNDAFAALNGFNGVTAQGNATGATTVTATSGIVTMTLTGNVTVALTAGVNTGDRLVLIMTQDGTGSRTFTKGTLCKLVGGAITLTTTAAHIDSIEFVFDGTNWLEIGRNLDIS